jgi:hypothetical protein
MKSATPGFGISPPEVTNISAFGLWLLLDDKEYFLAYADFPWFRRATIGQILSVELLGPGHLRWPELDVDLSVESLADPASFPLIDKTIDEQGGNVETPAHVAEVGVAYGDNTL